MNVADIIPNIPRLFTALAEWAACMIYVLVLKRRFKGIKNWLICAAYLGAFCLLQYIAGLLPLYLWIPGMAAAMLLTFFCLYSLCEIRFCDTVFWVARAFVLAEFAASLEWQLYYYFSSMLGRTDSTVIKTFFLITIYGLAFSAAFFLERRYAKSNIHLGLFNKDTLTSAIIAISVFFVSNISFISWNTPLSGSNAREIYYIRTLVDLCGLIMLYAQQEQRLWLHAKLELDAMQNVFSRQYDQYRLSKENIELLNSRFHDLKHQIIILKAETNTEKRIAYLEEMEKQIRLYDAQIETGNKVLDIILTGKSRNCAEHGINFTCVADGTLLDFMDIMDICSVFGNALDNAIESVSKLPDPEKRLIKMAVYNQNNFLMIRFENFIETKPAFENGLPVTTKLKNRSEVHGYGLKSIKSTAEKYGGSISISVTGDWFRLCLLISLDGVIRPN